MKIIEYNGNPEEWNQFVIANSSPASFLQSWEWGEFNQKELGSKIARQIFIDDDSNVLAVVLEIRKKLPMGGFFYYYPRGLVLDKQKKASWAEILSLAVKDLKTRPMASVFVRVNPPYEFVEYKDSFFKRMGLMKPKILTSLKEPGKTLVLDLTLSEDDLLKQMHHKTRYNIKLALKNGVKIRLIDKPVNDEEIKIFFDLTQQTAERDGIKIYTYDYYQKLISFLRESKNGKNSVWIRQYIAEYNGQPLSSIVVVYFGDTATYLFGASTNQKRNLMPNYAIQWQAIRDAKADGLKCYDFWGISDSNLDWAGITRFKRGFGGRVVRYVGTWDLVLKRHKYYIFWGLRLIRRVLRLK